MNAHSSRSHAIFTVTIECSDKGPDGKQRVRVGKLHLVDLAVRFLNALVMNLLPILGVLSKFIETLYFSYTDCNKVQKYLSATEDKYKKVS